MKYLEIEGHDNDFGFSLESALRRIWGWLNESNGHLCDVARRSLPVMFEELHNADALESLIQRAWVLEAMILDVEFNLRGLYLETVRWKEKAITTPIKDNLSDYLTFGIAFHPSPTFRDVWKNGEHAWLDLKNGDAGTF